MKHLVLIGLSGSGKSTAGALAAGKLNMPFIDIDRLVVERAGMAVSAIFKTLGEPRFRDLEAEITREVLERLTPTVIATGGGVVLRPENVRLLRKKGFVIYLDRSVDLITGDISCDGSRPLLKKADALYEMDRKRRPLYESAAHAVLYNRAGVSETADRLAEMYAVQTAEPDDMQRKEKAEA